MGWSNFLFQRPDKVDHDDLLLFLSQPIVLLSKSSEGVAGAYKLLDFFSQGYFHRSSPTPGSASKELVRVPAIQPAPTPYSPPTLNGVFDGAHGVVIVAWLGSRYVARRNINI